jgi:hypothetical protein
MEVIKIVNDKTGKVVKHSFEHLVSALVGSIANLQTSTFMLLYNDIDYSKSFDKTYDMFYDNIAKNVRSLMPCCCWSQVEDLVQPHFDIYEITKKTIDQEKNEEEENL